MDNGVVKKKSRPTDSDRCAARRAETLAAAAGEAALERWRTLYRALMAAGRIREMPVERITDVLSDLVYGTMFTNYFTGPRKPLDVQAQDILDIVFHGILTEPERRRRGPGGRTS